MTCALLHCSVNHWVWVYMCIHVCMWIKEVICVSPTDLPTGLAKVLQICASDWRAAAQPLLIGCCQDVYQGDMSLNIAAYALMCPHLN